MTVGELIASLKQLHAYAEVVGVLNMEHITGEPVCIAREVVNVGATHPVDASQPFQTAEHCLLLLGSEPEGDDDQPIEFGFLGEMLERTLAAFERYNDQGGAASADILMRCAHMQLVCAMNLWEEALQTNGSEDDNGEETNT